MTSPRVEYGLRLMAPEAPPNDPRTVVEEEWRAVLPEARLAAVYFGSEFCEDRLPDPGEALAYCEFAHDRGLQAALQTPLVTPLGLRAIDELLAVLAAKGHAPAVVFNDWGVLGLLRDRHPALQRRAGRLINRSLRDPRAYRDAPAGFATHDASRFARLRWMLATMGVAAVESDADLEGGYLGDGPGNGSAGLARALHLPFTFAASGRGCPLKAGLYPEGGGFSKGLADPCPAPCRGRPLPVRREDTPLPHWRAGNTLFYELPWKVAESWVPRAERIVLHEQPTP